MRKCTVVRGSASTMARRSDRRAGEGKTLSLKKSARSVVVQSWAEFSLTHCVVPLYRLWRYRGRPRGLAWWARQTGKLQSFPFSSRLDGQHRFSLCAQRVPHVCSTPTVRLMRPIQPTSSSGGSRSRSFQRAGCRKRRRLPSVHAVHHEVPSAAESMQDC